MPAGVVVLHACVEGDGVHNRLHGARVQRACLRRARLQRLGDGYARAVLHRNVARVAAHGAH